MERCDDLGGISHKNKGIVGSADNYYAFSRTKQNMAFRMLLLMVAHQEQSFYSAMVQTAKQVGSHFTVWPGGTYQMPPAKQWMLLPRKQEGFCLY